MTDKKRPHQHAAPVHRRDVPRGLGLGVKPPERTLEIVLKCDTSGTAEAVSAHLKTLGGPDALLKIIHSGVGQVSKSDLLMAATASKLVLGFDVGVAPKLDHLAKEYGVEVRLYNVIYSLARDLKDILGTLSAVKVEEMEQKVTGTAKVIALFKSSTKGIILGCEVLEGTLAVGRTFRVITAMGAAYSGRIESLQIESKPMNEAKVGQQVGLKISDFKDVKVGDLVECYARVPPKRSPPWEPKGSVIRVMQ